MNLNLSEYPKTKPPTATPQDFFLLKLELDRKRHQTSWEIGT